MTVIHYCVIVDLICINLHEYCVTSLSHCMGSLRRVDLNVLIFSVLLGNCCV